MIKRHRAVVGLTQEALAEKSGLSVRAIRGLEKGERHQPRPDTVGYLTRALEISGRERDIFETAAGLAPSTTSTVRDTELTLSNGVSSKQLPVEQHFLEPPTPLVGRERMLAEATTLLRREDVRLLTLTGPGGVGKTRAGLKITGELESGYADGVVVVALAGIEDPDLVALVISRALGLREGDDRLLIERLIEHLADKELLLFLDNFEQVLEAETLIAELISRCPGLKVVVTSRSALRVRCEQKLAILPLEAPDISDDEQADAAAISSYPAVALFIQRSRAVDSKFSLTDENASAIAKISRRLDGLPLAIELAASRVELLSPEALLRRLDDGLGVLTGGGPDLPERQRTMRAVIAWSYELLSKEEKVLFRRLGAFSGSSTIEAAEAVCRPDLLTSQEDSFDVLSGLASLVNASLLRSVKSTAPGGEPRISMLETIHEYARERLAASDEEVWIRDRHCSYFLDLAEKAEPLLFGPDSPVRIDRLQAEHDNLWAALRWSRKTDPEVGLRLVGALRWFWWMSGRLVEGRAWTEDLLSLSSQVTTNRTSEFARAKALQGAAELAHAQGCNMDAAEKFEESLEIYRKLEEKAGIASVLVELGSARRFEEDTDRTMALSEEGLTLSREVGDLRHAAIALNTLGHLARKSEEIERAAAYYEESLGLFRQVGDRRGTAYSLGNLGKASLEAGEPEEALRLHEESLKLYEDLRDKPGRAFALVNLGDAARSVGDEERARSVYEAGQKLHKETGNRKGVDRVLNRLISVS